MFKEMKEGKAFICTSVFKALLTNPYCNKCTAHARVHKVFLNTS